MMARTGGFQGVVPPDNVAGKRESGPPFGGAAEQHEPPRGGGGNRTRVLRYITRASPGAACVAFLSPGGPAG